MISLCSLPYRNYIMMLFFHMLTTAIIGASFCVVFSKVFFFTKVKFFSSPIQIFSELHIWNFLNKKKYLQYETRFQFSWFGYTTEFAWYCRKRSYSQVCGICFLFCVCFSYGVQLPCFEEESFSRFICSSSEHASKCLNSIIYSWSFNHQAIQLSV